MPNYNTSEARALAAYEEYQRENINLRAIYFPLRKPQPVRTLKAEFQGRLVKLAVIGDGGRAGGGKRGAITEFSYGSRRRLLQLFARLDAPENAVFITLTYPDEFPQAAQAKNHLRAFLERIRRRFGDTSGVWRLEFQKRGAPHFHLIFFGLPFVPKEDIQKWWGEIIDYEKPFTRIELIRSRRGIMSYVSKYVAKISSGGAAAPSGFNSVTYLHGVGRWWGVFERDKLPFAPLEVIEWPNYRPQIYDFRRYARRYNPRTHKSPRFGFFLFVQSAYRWLNLFQFALLPDGF